MMKCGVWLVIEFSGYSIASIPFVVYNYAMETTQNTLRLRTTPKDFFLHLGAIVALYISVISIITLLLAIIDQLYPKPFEYVDPYAGGVSVALAMIFIASPLYFLFMHFIISGENEQPEKRELSVRKWLTFITLFVAGLAMAIDLTVLLQKFFAGEEITLAFALKVVAIILVLATVFGYYLYDVRSNPAQVALLRPRFTYGAGAFIIFSIVLGFWVMGSPYTQKEKRFDAERISHLQMVQSQIISYWQAKQKLPKNLEDIKDPLSGFVLPVDPRDQSQYEYVAKDRFSFQLCATFSRETPAGVAVENFARPLPMYKNGLDENWKHSAGKVCFERTVDPELYPPLSATIKLAPAVR